MRLISNIHDYYDSIFRTSVQDKRDTFIRTRTVIENTKLCTHPTITQSTKCIYTLDTGVIGFCGRIYPFVKVNTVHKFDVDKPSTTNCYYMYADFLKNNPEIRDAKTKISNNCYGTLHTLKGIQGWLEQGKESNWSWNKNVHSVLSDPFYILIFRKHKVAYFCIEERRTTLYPILKDYQFFKVYNITTTFQMIELYLHNDLAPRDEVNIPISDILKAETHGFDRFSFRKDPTSKKRKK